MSVPSYKSSGSYRSLVQRLAEDSPGYQKLSDFLNENHFYQSPTRFSLVQLNPPSSEDKPAVDIKEFDGTTQLIDELDSTKSAKDNCCLLIVENVCSETISILGERFDIDPQFFADHLNNAPWYRIDDILNRIPALPSSQKLHDFLQMRYIDTQTISMYQNTFPGSAGRDVLDTSGSRSFMWPDENTTRIPRKAGKLIPRAREGKEFEPLLCTRQVLTAWFKNLEVDLGGWTGMPTIPPLFPQITFTNSLPGLILVDSPFRLPPGRTYSVPTTHRSFLRRPSILSSPTSIKPPTYTREVIAHHIHCRFSSDTHLGKAVWSDPFLLLGDVYRLVASKWIIINEYINRELATIEYILEKEEPGFRDLEVYLKDLYIYRRRCTRYHELITEAKEQCSARGQRSWVTAPLTEVGVETSRDVEGDFVFLLAKTERTAQRIEKNINLLTALVAIGEGKQGLDENHGISRLSLLAAIFLPFSTVATILSMQGSYAPGQEAFWVFWASAIPLWAFIIVVSVLYDGVGRKFLLRVMSWFRRRRRG